MFKGEVQGAGYLKIVVQHGVSAVVTIFTPRGRRSSTFLSFCVATVGFSLSSRTQHSATTTIMRPRQTYPDLGGKQIGGEFYFRFFCFPPFFVFVLFFSLLASWLLGFLASWLLGFVAFRLLGFSASWLLGFSASWLLLGF